MRVEAGLCSQVTDQVAERTPPSNPRLYPTAKPVPLQVVWPALVAEFGWTKVHGPRTHDVYYLPMGIARGVNGAKCRVDYYDSNRQVGLDQRTTPTRTPASRSV